MNYVQTGKGKPLLLLHPLGGSSKSWNLVLNDLSSERRVIAVDLPGFGETPPSKGEVSIRTQAEAVTEFLKSKDLLGIDAAGSSSSGRLVLELARRGGILGNVVALNPGGFWSNWQRHFFFLTLSMSARLVRLLQPAMASITQSAVGRTLLLAQFSAHPWSLDSRQMLKEMKIFASSPSFFRLLEQLAHGETQKGAPLGSIRPPLTIAWGRQDRVCFPSQAKRALELFPDASLYWFESSGHFPQWDVPRETSKLILSRTGLEWGAFPAAG